MDEIYNQNKLSNFKTTVIINVLNHTICELQLLRLLPGWSNSEAVEGTTMYESNVAVNSNIVMRFQQERLFVEETLRDVRSNLLENNTWSTLENTVNNLKNENENQCNTLKEQVETLQGVLVELKKKTSAIEKAFEEEIKQKDAKISKLKDEIEDAIFQQEVEIKYVDSWESSRIGQGLMLAEIEERRLKNQLENLHYQTENEERVHTEIANYLETAIEILEEEVVNWKKEYKEKIYQYNEELLATRERREIQLNKLQALADKYHHHGQKIKEYLEEKRQREEEEALQEHLNKMATRIQAWWRGVMVRRHLGPFKKKGKLKEKPKFKGKMNNKSDLNDTTARPKGK